MTAIVALAAADGSVVLGGDSYCGEDCFRAVCAAPKVWRCGPLGIGTAGEVHPETQFRLALAAFVGRGKVTHAALTDALPDFLRERVDVSDAGEAAGEWLLAFDGAIYVVWSDLAPWRAGWHFAAVGAAGSMAAAAVRMAAPKPPRTAREAARVVVRALEVVAELHPQVMGPHRTVVVRREVA